MTEKAVIRREKILEAAEKLFYEKGYDDTSFEQIAGECGITKPLISYHFKAKKILAGNVYKNTLDRFARIFIDTVGEIMPDVSPISRTIACASSYVEYYKQNENARRFFLELISSASIEDLGDLENNYRIANRLIGGGSSDDRIHLIYISSNYALHGLIKHYLTDDVRGSKEDFLSYFATVWLRNFPLTDDQISRYAEDANIILSNIDVIYEDHFRISVRPRS